MAPIYIIVHTHGTWLSLAHFIIFASCFNAYNHLICCLLTYSLPFIGNVCTFKWTTFVPSHYKVLVISDQCAFSVNKNNVWCLFFFFFNQNEILDSYEYTFHGLFPCSMFQLNTFNAILCYPELCINSLF